MICQPTDEALQCAAELIRGGGLVAFPTETVYGLGANALDEAAVRRIFAAKERPWESPLIVHVADRQMARGLAAEWSGAAEALASQFWPGPLTLVIPKEPVVPDVVTAGLPSVGLRMPRHPVALELIQRAGVPIAAPSANRFTQVSPTSADHVLKSLQNRVDLILDGGESHVGIESTVVSLAGASPLLLRPGMITQAQIEAVLGYGLGTPVPSTGAHQSPGQHRKHYAPRTKFVLLDQDETIPEGRGRILEMPPEPATFAHQLYAELRKADLEEWDWIAIRNPCPAVHDWQAQAAWSGVLDRLRRAATE